MKRTKRLRPKPKGPNREIGEWVANLRTDRCMWCGRNPATDVHHLERRNWAPEDRIHVACNLLAVCRSCHAGDLQTSDHAAELAAKLAADPEHFDLGAWLRIRDPELKAPNRVTMEDVMKAYHSNDRDSQ